MVGAAVTHSPTVHRRERLRAEMFGQIKRTARALLAADGPSAMSVRAIAREIRVTPAAIYRYHPSLHTLVAAVQDDILDELTARLETVRARADHPATRLRDTVRTFRHWALQNPAEFRLVFAQPEPGVPGSCPPPRLPRLVALLLSDLDSTAAPAPAASVAAAWARIYGLIATELSRHIDLSPATADVLFEQALEELSPLSDPVPPSS